MKLPPGFYHDVEPAAYHADPCEQPSLSSSIAQLLINQSPQHAWLAHPRLNPNYRADRDATRRLDVGSAAHALVLGKGRTIEPIEADDYRTKAARDKRDEARAAGKLPVLAADHDRAMLMFDRALRVIKQAPPAISHMFHSPVAASEVVAIWREGLALCRCMADRTDGRTIIDYKTVSNANPEFVARHIYDMGYHVQARFYLRGFDALDESGAGRRKFFFIAQEIDEPYACSFHELDGEGAALGDRLVEQAIADWQYCTTHNDWPSYPPLINRAELPPWKRSRLENEQPERPRSVPADLLMGG